MTVSLLPATDADVSEYLTVAKDSYLGGLLQAGIAPSVATSNAEQSFSTYFPNGRPASGQVVMRVDSDGQKVGLIWIGPKVADQPNHWWVLDIVIEKEFRGKGFGRQAMLLAEGEARSHGAVELALNVFGHNTVAVRLYQSLGYDTAAMLMRKQL